MRIRLLSWLQLLLVICGFYLLFGKNFGGLTIDAQQKAIILNSLIIASELLVAIMSQTHISFNLKHLKTKKLLSVSLIVVTYYLQWIFLLLSYQKLSIICGSLILSAIWGYHLYLFVSRFRKAT